MVDARKNETVNPSEASRFQSAEVESVLLHWSQVKLESKVSREI